MQQAAQDPSARKLADGQRGHASASVSRGCLVVSMCPGRAARGSREGIRNDCRARMSRLTQRGAARVFFGGLIPAPLAYQSAVFA